MVVITRYHCDAQTPDVRLHAVSLLVELWVYSFRLERRQKKTSEMTFLAQQSLWGEEQHQLPSELSDAVNIAFQESL